MNPDDDIDYYLGDERAEFGEITWDEAERSCVKRAVAAVVGFIVLCGLAVFFGCK